MISAERITHAYSGARVLRHVSLSAGSAGEAEMVGLVGPNGSGKTTLLRTFYRSLVPDEGVVLINGEPIRRMGARELARHVAVIGQEHSDETPLVVAEVVLLGRIPHLTTWQRPSERDVSIAADALRRVGAEHLSDRHFGELSGGEKQRVSIARALAQQATHLLMDEPTNHLDIHFQHEILQLVRQLPVTTVAVLHDLNLAARYCDRLLLLDSHGNVAASGSVDEVLEPDILEPVYRVRMERVVAADGRPQLLSRPFTTQRGCRGA